MRRREAWWAWLAGLVVLLVAHRYLFRGEVQAGRDLFRLFIPETEFLRERWLEGEVPWWISRVRLGQPFLATLYTQALYPPRVVLALVLGAPWGVTASVVLHGALAAVGAALAAREWGGRPAAALVAGSFGLTPFFMRTSPSLHIISALAWSGFLIAAALRLRRSSSPRVVALLALAFAASFHSGAPEMLLWQGPLVLAVAWHGHARWAAMARAVAGLALGVGLSVVVAAPAIELSRELVAPGSSLPATLQWSTSPVQLLSMGWLLAEHPAGPLYGPDQWFTTSLFVGAVPCALALLALVRRRVRPVAAVGLWCGVLSLGGHFAPAAWVLAAPPWSLFRFPVKHAFGLAFCIALLASIGLRHLVALHRRRRPTRVQVAAIGAAAVLGLVIAVRVARALPVREGVPMGLFWFGGWVALVALLVLVSRRVGARPTAVRVALGLVVVLELLAATQLVPPATVVDPRALQAPSALAETIRAQAPVRLSVDFNALEETLTDRAQGEPEAAQYLQRSRERLVPLRGIEERLVTIEGYGFRDWWRLSAALEPSSRGGYDVLGVTHFVRPPGPPPFDGLEVLEAAASGASAFRSPAAFPRAWVVHRAEVMPAAQAIAVLRDEPARLRHTVLLESGEARTGPECPSTATIASERDERLVLEVDACAPGHLVVSDAAFPGWTASVDGTPAPVLRANGLIRAVAVERGTHRVELWYRAPTWPWAVSLGCLGWLISLLVAPNWPRSASNLLKSR